jgi:hypothetical protein
MKPLNKIILAVIIFGVIASLGLGLWGWHENAEPSYAQMRAFRLASLSDDQIRELPSIAKKIMEDYKESAEKERKSSEEESRVMRQQCASDNAYRERTSACSHISGLITSPITVSYDQAYEMALMGVCIYISTIREARAHGCLPN